MWGWLKPVFDSLFTSILASITAWYRQEEAEAAKSQAMARKAQLEATKAGLEAQAAMHRAVLDARGKVPQSGAQWNSMLLLLTVLLLSTGCFRHEVFIHPLVPVPPAVERPVLDDTSAFSLREQTLALYATELSSSLSAARAYAIEQNLTNGYFVDPEDAAWLAAYKDSP